MSTNTIVYIGDDNKGSILTFRKALLIASAKYCSTKALSKIFSMSERSVYRALKEWRESKQHE